MTKISIKWNLIWLDVKSWLTTCVLIFSPLALGAATNYVNGQNMGEFGVVLLSALGALLKFAQKWITSSAYIVTEEIK